LNDAEAGNVGTSLVWLESQELLPSEVLRQGFLRELHRRMFSDVWTWAGRIRLREISIGVPPPQILEQTQILLGDVSYWIKHESYCSSEIGVRFHHRLVAIHLFVNGNGRHARLVTGALGGALGLSANHCSWGSRSDLPPGVVRQQYLTALRDADRHDYAALLKNAVG
jgi:Fic-DOC domain mobile mystery protein B